MGSSWLIDEVQVLFEGVIPTLVMLTATIIHLMGRQYRGLFIRYIKAKKTMLQTAFLWTWWVCAQAVHAFVPFMGALIAARFIIFLRILLLADCRQNYNADCKFHDYIYTWLPTVVTFMLLVTKVVQERRMILAVHGGIKQRLRRDTHNSNTQMQGAGDQ